MSSINLSSRRDTPPSGGRTRPYATAVREAPGGDTPGQRSGVSLILSHNGASGDTPESSGMIPNRSTSGAAQGETPDAVARLTSGTAQGETPDAIARCVSGAAQGETLTQ